MTNISISNCSTAVLNHVGTPNGQQQYTHLFFYQWHNYQWPVLRSLPDLNLLSCTKSDLRILSFPLANWTASPQCARQHGFPWGGAHEQPSWISVACAAKRSSFSSHRQHWQHCFGFLKKACFRKIMPTIGLSWPFTFWTLILPSWAFICLAREIGNSWDLTNLDFWISSQQCRVPTMYSIQLIEQLIFRCGIFDAWVSVGLVIAKWYYGQDWSKNSHPPFRTGSVFFSKLWVHQ